MAIAYSARRGHLDDILELGGAIFARRRLALDAPEAGQRLGELDVAIVGLAETIEARLALTRARGSAAPLDELRTAFQLEATEQRCLWLLLALAVSEELRGLAGVDDDVPLALLDDVVYAAPAVRDRFAIELGPAGRLARLGLIETATARPRDGFLGRSVRIAERIVDLAFGIDGLARDVAGFARLIEPDEVELLDAAEVASAVHAALAHHVEAGAGAVPLLRGAEGSGRQTIVGLAARALGARLLVVRCADLPLGLDRAMTAVQREAILHRAVIVMCDLEALADDPATGQLDRTRVLDLAFAHYTGPLALTACPSFARPLVPSRGAIVFDMPATSEAVRAELWYRALPRARSP